MCVQMFKCSNVQMFKCSNVQMFKCSNVQMRMEYHGRWRQNLFPQRLKSAYVYACMHNCCFRTSMIPPIFHCYKTHICYCNVFPPFSESCANAGMGYSEFGSRGDASGRRTPTEGEAQLAFCICICVRIEV
jgi:hypothetical protein